MHQVSSDLTQICTHTPCLSGLNLAVHWAPQIFVTPDTLYLVLWSLAKQPQPGQDAAAHRTEMIQELAKWATLLQTCSPGAKVQLVGSHKDKVADEALVEGIVA